MTKYIIGVAIILLILVVDAMIESHNKGSKIDDFLRKFLGF
jgi:hypothetical protein